jgi:hypothetical protein
MKQKSGDIKNGSKTLSCGSSSSAAAAANSLRRVGGVNEHELGPINKTFYFRNLRVFKIS